MSQRDGTPPPGLIDVECPKCHCEYQVERQDAALDNFAECPECGFEVQIAGDADA